MLVVVVMANCTSRHSATGRRERSVLRLPLGRPRCDMSTTLWEEVQWRECWSPGRLVSFTKHTLAPCSRA